MSDAALTKAERLQGLAGRALGRLPARVQRGLSGRRACVVDGQTLDAQLQMLLAFRRRLNPYNLCEPTPEAARVRFRREMQIFGGPKTRVGAVRDFEIPGTARSLRVRLYAPEATGAKESSGMKKPLLVYLHGGGFVIGDLDTHDEACRLLCLHAEVFVLSVEYRLAPEHPFPAALEDSLSALSWAQENAASLGADASRVALGGDSAGANLSAVASRLAAHAGAPPRAQLLIYPPTDGVTPRPSQELFGEGFFLCHADREAFTRHYLEGTGVGVEDPRVSPLRAPTLAGLPPALLVTAGFDLLRDEGEAYAEALRAEGTRVRLRRFPSLAHGFVNMTGVSPAARRALVEVAREWRALTDETETQGVPSSVFKRSDEPRVVAAFQEGTTQ
ncbi:MAG TPA: alpha/beta hydrolase [Pyrinomonadaceae bacterium]|nr:alpha/beta hydrolase [Pyrinomonadaceae bacterium]